MGAVRTGVAHRNGLVWVEVLAGVAAVGALLIVLAVMASRTRSMASLGQTMSNLRFWQQGFAVYADDYADRVAVFSWTAGNCPSQYADLQTAATDLDAAANQASDIIRRRSTKYLPRLSGWIPYGKMWYLVLADYLDVRLPVAQALSLEDRKQLALTSDPTKWGSGDAGRFPFQSSYEISMCFWDSSPVGSGASQDGNSYIYFNQWGTAWGKRAMSEVAYPSAKAVLFDRVGWHFGPRAAFFMYAEARVPVMMTDGSTSVRSCVNSNPGWKPLSPASTKPSRVTYDPVNLVTGFDPPTMSGGAFDVLDGRLRYTRGGLLGRDFDGPETQ